MGDSLLVMASLAEKEGPRGKVQMINIDAAIACWFVDTDCNGESSFVRHACFTGTAPSGAPHPAPRAATAGRPYTLSPST